MKTFKEVWAVDSGAYENNGICWIFTSREEAEKYASLKNREAEEKGIYRDMDSYYNVSSYKVAETWNEANSEDFRMADLYKNDPTAWRKEVGLSN